MARFDMGSWTGGAAAGGGETADALFELGLRYSAGRDAPLDLVSAHMWFNLAAARGNVEARRHRSEVAGELTRDDVALAQRLAREWLATH